MTQKKLMLIAFALTIVFAAVFFAFLSIFASAGGGAFEERPAVVFRHMRREFSIYSRPDFFSDRLSTHQGQMVQILKEQDDGWLQVSFRQDIGWVYPFVETHYLERPMGLYHCKLDERYTSLIGPGPVRFVEQEGDWILVITEDGPMWLDKNFMPPFCDLRDFFDALPSNISVFYRNLDTDFIFGHRDNIIFASASLNKAPHALYVYHLAERGLIDLSRIHTFNPINRRDGTGVMQFMPYGTQFTTSQLLIHSVRDSDNVAFRMLLDTFANYPITYHDFYASLGGDVSLVRNISGHQMTAAEAGLIMFRIYEYLQSGTSYSNEFKYSLLNSDVPIIMADYPVAQKYGRWAGNFHDMAIVYAPSPYILTILSTLDRDDTGGFEEFAEISAFIQDFNNRYFRPQ